MNHLPPAETAQLDPEPRKRPIGFIAGAVLGVVIAVVIGRLIG